MADAEEKDVSYFERDDGGCPFEDWLEKLRRKKPRAAQRIDAKIRRIVEGNLGDCRSVGGGVSELEIDEGPGYRVYIGQHGRSVIILHGNQKGTKSNQQADIMLAQKLWTEWKESS